MEGMDFLIDVVQVVHADADPGGHLLLADFRDPDGVEIELVFVRLPGAADPFEPGLAGLRWEGLEEGLVRAARGIKAGEPGFAVL